MDTDDSERFDIDRRDILQTIGAGSLLAAELSGSSVASTAASGDPVRGFDAGQHGTPPGPLSVSDWEWESVTEGDASTEVLDQYNINLQVYKCSYAALNADLGSVTDGLRLAFDWETEADQWYESTRLAIFEDGEEVLDIGFQKEVGGIVEGSEEVTVEADGEVLVSFYIEPSNYCDNPDHYNTYFRIRNISMETLETGTVAGTVTDQTGEPLPDVGVEFVPEEEDTPEATVLTDDSGEYSTALPTGEYEAVVDAEGFESVTVPVSVVADETQVVDVELAPLVPVSGTVTTGTGNPLADITLEFVPGGAGASEETATTDSNGAYSAEVPPDEYAIVIEEELVEPREIPVQVTAGEPTEQDITLSYTDTPVTITQTEVAPDALLGGVNNKLNFAIGVDSVPGAPVGQVEIHHDDTVYTATNVENMELGAIVEILTDFFSWDDIVGEVIGDPKGFIEETVFAEPPSQVYLARMPQTGLDVSVGDNEFEILATTPDGIVTESQVAVPVYEQGTRFGKLNPVASGSDVEFGRNTFGIDYDFNFGDDLMPDNLPIDLDIPIFKAVLDYDAEGSLDLDTLEATATDRSAGGVQVFARGVEFQIGARWDGTTDGFTYNMSIVDLWLAAIISTPIPLPKKLDLTTPDSWPVIGGQGVEVSLSATPGGYMLFGESDPTTPGTASAEASPPRERSHGNAGTQNLEIPVPPNREFNTYFTLDAAAGITIVESFINGSIHRAADIINGVSVITPPVGVPGVPVGGKVCLDGGLRISVGDWSATASIETLTDLTPGFSEPCATAGTVREPPCWEVFGVDGDCQTYPSSTAALPTPGASGFTISTTDLELAATTGENPPGDAITAETDAGAVTRLTDRSERDRTPAVAVRENSHLAVWQRHPDGAAAEDGRTLVTATRDETGWTDPTTLADTTGVSYHDPAVAADSGAAAVAWTRHDIDGAGSPPAFEEITAVEVVLEDGDGWSDPVVVAETGEWVERTPAIVSLGDGWVLAWERVAADSDTRAVGYTVLDATGAVQQSETIQNAARPALGTTSDGVVLAYHDRNGSAVRRDLVTESGRTGEATYDVPGAGSVQTLTVAGQGTAWVLTDQETTTGFYAANGTVEELDFVTAASPVRALTLAETAAGPVVTGARVPDDDVRTRSLTYHLRANGGWRPQQVSATADAAEDVTIRDPAVAPTTDGNGLVTLLGAKVHDPDAVQDVFAVEQPFRPNYAITAQTAEGVVPPGEDLTVSYTVENTGDLDGSAIGDDPVPVEVRSQGTTLAEQTVSPLARGETASGQLTFTVDETGTAEVVVGRNLDLLAPGERRTTVEASTPRLAVESTSVERPDEGTAIGTVKIRNGGPVDADPFEVAVYAGDGSLLGDAEAAGPAAGESSSVTVEFDPAVLGAARGEQIHIDPGEDLPESHVTQRVSPVLLGQPDLTVADEVAYSETGDGVVATLALTNTGPLSTSVTVRAVTADATPEGGSFPDEDILGTVERDLPAAIDGTPQTADVSLALEGVEYGDELRFVVESARPVAGTGIPVVSDRVGPFSGVPALPGYESPPRDLNGDGLYEDVDGDGEFDIFDVQALFNGLESDAVQSNPEAFTFSTDSASDQVTILDVQALFHRLSERD